MKTPTRFIDETYKASELIQGFADALEEQIEDGNLLISERQKLDHLYFQLRKLRNEFEDSACAMQEENLNLQNA
jgi:hypothetical protein